MIDAKSDMSTAARRRAGKRERLVAAAVQLLYRQGVERTTLAEIAKAAEVPVGGVYYYFKTKDDATVAVIEAHAQQTKTALATIEARHQSPKSRLKAFVDELGTTQRELVTRFGCPLGSLCSELGKRDSDPTLGAELMRVPVEWAEQQFRALGHDDAHDLALDLIAAYEGSALLANTLRDSDILARTIRRIGQWIDTL
jgi:AcrR family transcriptional regulator